MILENLKFDELELSRGAILIDDENHQIKVFVPILVLQKAFITRAWLDRTLINCAIGKCRLGVEAEQRGNVFEATSVWLSSEKKSPDEPRNMFKNFGLELNKPQAGTEPFKDLVKLEKVSGKLAKRFIEIENSNKLKSVSDLCNFRFDNLFLENLANRHLHNATALTGNNNLIVGEFTPDWRMVTGMGEASVYETNLTLHHVYGIPYIPASTIKGVLRHYLSTITEGKQFVEQIFGNGDKKSKTNKPVKGQCIFFDAFPLKAPRIELDVMTPHFPDYYTGNKPPADWQSPTPIHFLTIGHGTPFRFMIGVSGGPDSNILKTKLEKWLKESLISKGIGSKTSVGYGYWSLIN